MKQSLSITQLAQQLEHNKHAKEDFVVTTNALRYHPRIEHKTPGDEKTSPRRDIYRDDSLVIYDGADVMRQLTINNHTHGQIASRLDIPRKYYNRLRQDAPELLAQNINHFFEKEPERRMVRTLDGAARAFMSDKYLRIENEQIAGAALPVLAEVPDIQVVSSAITEHKMYIKAVTPRVSGEVSVGDVVQAGVVIKNSEVGAGAVSIERLIYRLVCTNGMVLPDRGFRANHVGGVVGDTSQIAHMLSDETLAADDHVILLKVRDVVRSCLSQEGFDAALEDMRRAKDDRINGDVPKAVETLGKKFSMNEGETSGVLRHLIEGGDLSRFGLLNAVTRQSQDIADYDRASDFESFGGKILNLSRSEFREIAEAA